jgi:surface carbohydrate biosynthesis protein
MNIYIHLEISARELDSKLLLAVNAASRGHEVIISDQESIIKGLERKFLKSGIYYTKSLTPGKSKIINHSKILNTGCKITSIDEEAGLVDYGYKKFALNRYSTKTLNQASAVFAWGPEDFKTLKKNFPNHTKKIYMTGSPRVDLWRPNFFDYWKKKIKRLNKPYLLIPSNFSAGLAALSFYERIKISKKGGYLDRDPELLKKSIENESERYKMIGYFIEAINYLARQNKNYHIVLRPHPTESFATWKILLDKTPNVSVIQEDEISLWIKNAFAILHNGCTTALEASFFKKPIITYSPFKFNFSRELANDLGQKVTSIQELSKKIDNIFLKNLKIKKQKKLNQPLPKILINKIFVDEKETASNKIIKIWETIDNKGLSKSNNWFIYKLSLKIMKLNGALHRFVKNDTKFKKNIKFPPFEKEKILFKFNKLIKILKINHKLNCEFLSDRTILIRKK